MPPAADGNDRHHGTGGTTAPGESTLPDVEATGREVTESIADGLEPEAGPLRIVNYADYVNPDVVADFEDKYGVKVEITTIDSDAEMIHEARHRARSRST